MMKISELRMKDVIESNDGRRLGYINDMEIDAEQGRIAAIVIPGPRSWRSLFGRVEETVLPWERIVKLGVDVILVQKESSAAARSANANANADKVNVESEEDEGLFSAPSRRPSKNAATNARRPWDEEFDFFDV